MLHRLFSSFHGSSVRNGTVINLLFYKYVTLRASSCSATENHPNMERILTSSQYILSNSHEDGNGVQVLSLESAKRLN
jgi:hypothetical protein